MAFSSSDLLNAMAGFLQRRGEQEALRIHLDGTLRQARKRLERMKRSGRKKIRQEKPAEKKELPEVQAARYDDSTDPVRTPEGSSAPGLDRSGSDPSA